MTDPITFTSDEVNLIADEDFFMAKARISAKVRQTLAALHQVLREELNGRDLIVPKAFDPDAFQFVKGEHLEDFPYQYLDCPRHFTREEKYSFRSLFWWGHHVVFAMILEGSHMRRYKQNLINRYLDVADRKICLCLSSSLWEWKQGPGYTLELTHTRKSEVAAVLAHRPFFKLARFISMDDPIISAGGLPEAGREAFRAVLPVITT